MTKPSLKSIKKTIIKKSQSTQALLLARKFDRLEEACKIATENAVKILAKTKAVQGELDSLMKTMTSKELEQFFAEYHANSEK